MSIIISFLISLSVAHAAPEACSTVDLTAPNEALASVPSWSQGHSNLCYAYSASTLIDAYRFKKGDKDVKHFTSPLLLAARTIAKYSTIGSTLAGGKVEHAFASARNFGSCDVKFISDKLGPYETDRILNTLTENYHKSKEDNVRIELIAEELIRFLQSAGIRSENLPTVAEVEKNLELPKDEFVAETLLKFCGDTKNLGEMPSPTLLFRPRVNETELLERLQGLLTARVPVGINFCANVVTNPDHRGYLEKGKWVCKQKMNHSAIIAGRKIKDGQCQFLVQDTGCEGYTKSTSGCVAGRYWVPVDRMMANAHGLFWLE